MKMKALFFLVVTLLTACSYGAVKSNPDIKELNAAMAYGSMKELNNIDPNMEKDLLVRLYQVPIMGERCFVETHGVCQNSYYISVSTFDEFPETNVFKLNMAGDVSRIQWLQENQYDYVEIEFTLSKYTKEAMANNDSLINTQSKVLVKLTPINHIEIIR